MPEPEPAAAAAADQELLDALSDTPPDAADVAEDPVLAPTGPRGEVAERFTEDRFARIISALKAGNTRRASAAAGAISDRTLRRWILASPEIRDRVEQAEAAAEIAHVANLNRAVKERNPQVSMWWLERRRPEDYGRVDRVEMIVRRKQAEQLAEEARAQGYDVTPDDILREYDTLAQKALPPGSKRRTG